MSTTAQLAKRISLESPTPDLLHDLHTVVNQPETASSIVSAMLSQYQMSLRAQEAACSVMERLEKIAEADPELGCGLMAHLWVIASQIDGAFDVTDAIDLWLANTNTVAIESQLRYIAETSKEKHVIEHFRNMAKM
ncbi:MAG: hypothetical protein J0M26_27455 [Planctomycetes bacterium]|nr:hypothetical protein [Planctomycetota bacterium]